MSIELIQVGITQGLLLALIAFGVMVPFRFLDFPDLSAEGIYPLGGALCTCLIIIDYNPFLSTIISSLICGLAAIFTCQISLRLKVNSLLAGIILSTMLYSINLRIIKKPSLSLFNYHTIDNTWVIFIILLVCVILFALFLQTDFGLRFRAVGINPLFIKRKNVSINKYTSLGLFIAGCMFGLAGSLIVQMQQFMDIGMGTGIVIHGLASLMIGEAITKNTTLTRQLLAPIIGALIYQQIQGLALNFGLAPSDLKIFTASIVLLVLWFKKSQI